MPEHCPFCKRLEALISRQVACEAALAGRPASDWEKSLAAQARMNRLESVADFLFALSEKKRRL